MLLGVATQALELDTERTDSDDLSRTMRRAARMRGMTFSAPSATVPDLLTVEEAASILRIGRTKAYALTQAWRDTGGEFGIPVIEIGGLRVPKARLEEMIGAPILTLPAKDTDSPEQSAPKAPELRSLDGDLVDVPFAEVVADDAQTVLPFSA